MVDKIIAGDKVILRKGPVFIIAEAGINHNGDFNIAVEMVKRAVKTGIDAIKFQTYITEKRVSRDSPLFDVLKKCELSFEKQAQLKKIADSEGILFFSTPFDKESVEFLNDINVSLMKIASFDITNSDLLNEIVKLNIPLIISRGMATKEEIDKAIARFSVPLALLHCVSAYPAPKDSANLNVIRTLLQLYDCPIGYSDHTPGAEAAVYAVACGATVIEKHYTLDTKMEGPDHKLSIDVDFLGQMVKRIREVEKMLGEGELKTYKVEEGSLIFRRK